MTTGILREVQGHEFQHRHTQAEAVGAGLWHDAHIKEQIIFETEELRELERQ